MSYREELIKFKADLLKSLFSYTMIFPDSERLGCAPSDIEVSMSNLLFEVDKVLRIFNYKSPKK